MATSITWQPSGYSTWLNYTEATISYKQFYLSRYLCIQLLPMLIIVYSYLAMYLLLIAWYIYLL